MDITVHINAALSHQVQHGEWLKKGFERHGHRVLVTSDIEAPGDVHVVSGPWYAKERWRGAEGVILLDRCYYRGNPEHVSLGWMRSDGGRVFKIGSGREPPRKKDRVAKAGSIFLADYDGPIAEADTIRLHPARTKHREGLHDALRRHARAIGYQTTALVTAALMGLEIECLDERNILWNENWLELLPYADWRYDEISDGTAIEHLLITGP